MDDDDDWGDIDVSDAPQPMSLSLPVNSGPSNSTPSGGGPKLFTLDDMKKGVIPSAAATSSGPKLMSLSDMKSMALPSPSPSSNHTVNLAGQLGGGEGELDDFMNNDDDPFEDKAFEIPVSSSAAASEAAISKSPSTAIAGASSPKGESGKRFSSPSITAPSSIVIPLHKDDKPRRMSTGSPGVSDISSKEKETGNDNITTKLQKRLKAVKHFRDPELRALASRALVDDDSEEDWGDEGEGSGVGGDFLNSTGLSVRRGSISSNEAEGSERGGDAPTTKIPSPAMKRSSNALTPTAASPSLSVPGASASPLLSPSGIKPPTKINHSSRSPPLKATAAPSGTTIPLPTSTTTLATAASTTLGGEDDDDWGGDFNIGGTAGNDGGSTLTNSDEEDDVQLRPVLSLDGLGGKPFLIKPVIASGDMQVGNLRFDPAQLRWVGNEEDDEMRAFDEAIGDADAGGGGTSKKERKKKEPINNLAAFKLSNYECQQFRACERKHKRLVKARLQGTLARNKRMGKTATLTTGGFARLRENLFEIRRLAPEYLKYIKESPLTMIR